MGSKPHDVARSFDELDPSQFADKGSRGSKLAEELVGNDAGTTADNSGLQADTRKPPTFGLIAAQLPKVEREIGKAERALVALRELDDAGAVAEVEKHLASLQAERVEIQTAMDRLTTKLEDPVLIEPDSKPASNNPYRLKHQELPAIKQELTKLPGWYRLKKELDKQAPGGARDYLEAVAHHVQAGTLPIERGFWFRITDSKAQPNQVVEQQDESEALPEKPQSRKQKQADAARRIRESRYFDADDDREQRQLSDDTLGFERPDEAGPTKRQLRRYRAFTRARLPQDDENGYDEHKDTNRSGEVTTVETQPQSDPEQQDPQRHLNSELADDLQDILAGRNPDSEPSKITESNDTEASYGAPPSPLDAESATVGADQMRPTTESQTQDQEQLSQIESAYTAEFGGQTFNRGDKILYQSDSGRMSEYYVLCNSIGEPPGLVVQSVANESMVFAIGADTEAGRVRKINPIEEPPVEQPPGEPIPPGEPPEGGPGDGEDDPEDGEGTPEQENPVDNVPTISTPEQVLEFARASRLNVEAQIRAVAQAKEEREKLFGRAKPRQEQLDRTQAELQGAYERYMNDWADALAGYRGQETALVEYRTKMEEELADRQESLERLEADENLSGVNKALRIRVKREAMEKNREAIDLCNQRILELRANVERITQELTLEMTLEMAQTRTKIEEAQTELKAGKLTQKFKNLWRSHPKTRLVVGVGLGIGGLVLGGAPGIAMMAGLAAMRGVGGYMGTEAAVNLRRRWWANRSDKKERQAAWNAQDQTTQWAAERNGYDIVRANGELSEQQTQDLAQFLTRHSEQLGNQEMMRAALAGNPEASSQIARLLLASQLERVTKDAKSNRRAKVAGLVVGAAAVIAPFAFKYFTDSPPETPKPPRPNPEPPTEAPRPPAPTPEPTPVPEPAPPAFPARPDLIPTDGRYPWTHMTELLGTNGTPRIMEIAQKAPQYGWQVLGEGGGGQGQVLKIIAPDGYEYTGNASINAALDYLNGIVK